MEDFLEISERMAEKAGNILMQHFRKNRSVERKSPKDIKTIYDEISDGIIKGELERNFPDHSYLTEETGFINKDSKYLWVIDPLDGTGNYANHNPLFAISIALFKKEKPLLGFIYAPAIGEKFIAINGKGAYRIDLIQNLEEKLKVSGIKSLNESYILWCEGGEKNRERFTNICNFVQKQVKDLRKLGSAALETSFVASGRAELYFTTKISFWDIAAGSILVKESGGKITDFNGKEYKFEDFLRNKEGKFDFIVSNGNLSLNLEDFKITIL